MTGPLLVTARLCSPLAGDPPHLDALLEWSLSPFEERFRRAQDQGVPHSRVDRNYPAPPQAVIPIPIMRLAIGPWQVALCSSPILPGCKESVDHVAKRIGVENAGLLAESERRIVQTTNSWTKGYRLPLRIRAVSCVRWFCYGNERNLKKALRDVHAIGKKVADGYGRVSAWDTEEARDDYSWYAPCEAGSVLMRPLPLEAIQAGVIGWRRHFGACVPPYWHPDRFTEVALPC